MVLEIPYGLAIVCGPETTTNLSFAERILGECPRTNKRLVPFPDTLLNHDSIIVRNSEKSDRLTYTHNIGQAYRHRQFTVCAGCYPDKERLESFLYQLRMMRIGFDVTLIKLMPKIGKGLNQVALQRYHDSMEIAQYSFQETMRWVKREYAVLCDHREVELKFL